MRFAEEYAAYLEAVLADARAYVRALPPARLAAFDRLVAQGRAAWTQDGERTWTEEAERGALMTCSSIKSFASFERDPRLLEFATRLECLILSFREPL